MGLEFYEDFSEPAKRPPGPRHARQVDPEMAVDIERRLAAMMVRRICNQHKCTGPGCTDENHRKDADYLLSTDKRYDPVTGVLLPSGMLDMLGLPHECPDITEKDRTTWLKWLRQAGPPEDDALRDAA